MVSPEMLAFADKHGGDLATFVIVLVAVIVIPLSIVLYNLTDAWAARGRRR